MAIIGQEKAVFAVLVFSAIYIGSFARSSYHVVQMNINDQATNNTGYGQNCGKSPFNMSWSPNPIRPTDNLKVHVNYTLPYNLDGGSYDLLLSFHGDKTPFLELADSFTCDDIKKYKVPCPIKKGFHIQMTKVLDHIVDIGSYPGDYDVKAIIKNKEAQELICLFAHIKIEKY